ncbi:MAG: triose-phosphate isomerase [bacterium]
MKRAKPIVIANWKGYVETPEEAKRFVQVIKRSTKTLSACQVMLAPSFTLLPTLVPLLKNSAVQVGSQAVSAHPGGAHTGEVTGAMLRAVGAVFSIVGHSERRALGGAGESEEGIQNQIARACEAGLGVVLCVGEHEREASGAHFGIIAGQLASALAAVPLKNMGKLMVAYEPVWAIGKTAADAMQPGDVQEVFIFIRKILVEKIGRAAALKVPILYGGSVEEENVQGLYHEGGVSGFLVGHASSKSDSFIKLIKALQ